MNLSNAKLCLDCGEIYDGEQCPNCGSEIYWWASKFTEIKKLEMKNVQKKEKETQLSA